MSAACIGEGLTLLEHFHEEHRVRLGLLVLSDRNLAQAVVWPADHGDVDAVYKALFAAGVDGLFSDFPGLAVKARG